MYALNLHNEICHLYINKKDKANKHLFAFIYVIKNYFKVVKRLDF